MGEKMEETGGRGLKGALGSILRFLSILNFSVVFPWAQKLSVSQLTG